MKLFKLYKFLFLILLALSLLFVQNTGCTKEYSFEGADTLSIPGDSTTGDTSIIPDTTVISSSNDSFPQCTSCHESDKLPLNAWSFKTANAFVCGVLTNPGFFSGQSRTAITLFGPSACSNDTGIVLSVYLPVPLDRDRYNITASASAFYYYDHNAPIDIFDSRDPYPFSITIQSYILSTDIVTGTFMGTVIKNNGGTAIISDGHFFAALH
jgi:hypothetical protein